MALPKKTKKEARSVSVTVRLAASVSTHLKTLASEHGLSQADVVSYLIENEYKKWTKSSNQR